MFFRLFFAFMSAVHYLVQNIKRFFSYLCLMYSYNTLNYRILYGYHGITSEFVFSIRPSPQTFFYSAILTFNRKSITV